MELREFVALVPQFSKLSQADQVVHFGWYLHIHGERERFDQAAIRDCYEKLSMQPPNLSLIFTRLLAKRPKVILQDGTGYFLEHGARQKLDVKYGEHETTIAISKMLKDLPGRISDEGERLFLSEAITCYHSRAFRAASIMAWNLAYDHLLHWILKDSLRLAAFNAHTAGRIGPKRATGLTIAKREDFEELKEAEVIDICAAASLFASTNTKQILTIQLTKRNLAAHPSLIKIEGPQADDAISSLVNNVVLVLK